jgi:hypothetical protein
MDNQQIQTVRQMLQNCLDILSDSQNQNPFAGTSVIPEDPAIEYYEMDGSPYDCKLGHSWFYRDKDGEWCSGDFTPDHKGFGTARIAKGAYDGNAFYDWMKNPGPGTTLIYGNPDFKAQMK